MQTCDGTDVAYFLMLRGQRLPTDRVLDYSRSEVGTLWTHLAFSGVQHLLVFRATGLCCACRSCLLLKGVSKMIRSNCRGLVRSLHEEDSAPAYLYNGVRLGGKVHLIYGSVYAAERRGTGSRGTLL